ncbi:Ral GTPase-activating protein subunit alpha-2 [Geranomyces variabilis]|uniref:Ral GTPase-activating protein subunit alpha-2 n=1 Tax=Geranomyces variabilis TaxID=109894 RepID=A0AAD5TH62_9FUNG|nr:Ral GTPase-activating protein subunit alpha-2 [Geranomyces variabilis]
MADEKRTEKLLKRAKPFLDEKLKAKQRLASLYSFMENSTEQDQAKFFRDHDYQIYSVMFDVFTHQVDKIKSREKPDKPLAITSKEVGDLYRSLHILKRITTFLPEKMRTGWQRRSIVGILQTLLSSTNHPKLRIEGLRILLLYLAPQTTEPPDTTSIYANAIPLVVFEPFPHPRGVQNADEYCTESQRKDASDDPDSVAGTPPWKGEGRDSIKQEPIEWERRIHSLTTGHSTGIGTGSSSMEKSALLPSSLPLSSYDSVDLFEEILQNLVLVAGSDPLAPPRRSSRQNSSHRSLRASSIDHLPHIGSDPRLAPLTQKQHSSFSDSKRSSAIGIDELTAVSDGEAPGSIEHEKGAATPPATAPNALRTMWEYFKKYYLRILFPAVSRRTGLEIADGQGFSTCPPQLLHALINFLIRNCVDSPVTPASTALRALLLGSDVANVEMVHEWLRQAMLLPCAWSDVIRGSVGVMRVWLGQNNDDRPPFLQLRTKVSHEGEVTTDNAHVDAYARRYIRYMRLAFSEKLDDIEHMDAQVSIFHEVLSLYRTLTIDSVPAMSGQTWRTLFSSLLDVTAHVLCQANPLAVIRDAAMASELAEFIFETVYITWVRSGIRDDEVWRTLRNVLQRCTGWKECVHQWEIVIMDLTSLISLHTYGVEPDFRLSKPSSRPSSSSYLASRPSPRPAHRHMSTGHRAPSTASSLSGHPLPAKRDRSNSILGSATATLNRRTTRAETVSGVSLKGAKSDTELSNSGPAHPASSDSGGTGLLHPSDARQWGLEFFSAKLREPSTLLEAKSFACDGTDGLDDDPLVLAKKGHLGARDAKESLSSLIALNIDANDNATSTEFGDLAVLPLWNAESALFAWENVLCVLGDLNDIASPANHATAMRALKEVWDALEYIRLAQPYESLDGSQLSMPPLFKFATWLFRAADLEDARADGRAIAYACMCRMMCRRHDQPFPNDYYPHFYRLLVKAFDGDDGQVLINVLANCKNLFTLGLPGSYILIEPFMRCVKRLFLVRETTTTAPRLPESARQDAITILSALICIANYFGEPRAASVLRPAVFTLANLEAKSGLPASRTQIAEGLLPKASNLSLNAKSLSISTTSLNKAAPKPLAPSPASLAAASATRKSVIDLFSPHPARSPEIVVSPPRSSLEVLGPPIPRSPASERESSRILGGQSPPRSPTLQTMPQLPVEASTRHAIHASTPSIPLLKSTELCSIRPLAFGDLRTTIKETLLALIEEEQRYHESQMGSAETLSMLQWGVTVMAFEEMMDAERPAADIVDDCINTLLDHLAGDNIKVVFAAADGLSFLAQNHSLLPYLDNSVLQGVAKKIIAALTEQLLFQPNPAGSGPPPSHQIRANIVSRLLYCLLDWTMVFPPEVWAAHNIANMVFEVLENALTVPEEVDAASPVSADTERPASTIRRHRGSIYEQSGTASGTNSASGTLRDKRPPDVRSSTSEKPGGSFGTASKNSGIPASKVSGDESTAGNSLIKESAENVMMHLLHHVNNFAPPHGPSMIGTQLLDPALQEDPKEGERHLYMSLNGTTLLTLVDMPGATPLDSRARLIVRDMTGRYAWDAHLFYESLFKMQQRVDAANRGETGENLLAVHARADPCRYQGVVAAMRVPDDVKVEERARNLGPDAVTYVRDKERMPLWEAERGVETADMLDELLQFIGNEHPDCLLVEETPLNVSSAVQPLSRDGVLETREAIMRQTAMEQRSLASAASEKSGYFATPYSPTSLGARKVSYNDIVAEDSSHPAPHPPAQTPPALDSSSSVRRRATVPHVNIDSYRSHGSLFDRDARAGGLANDEDSLAPANGYAHVHPIPYPRKIPPYQRARLLLSHLGQVDFDSLKHGNLQLLAETPSLYRDLKVLDRKHGRETVKLAVIYVGPGQEDEQSIFHNAQGSPEYRDFVASLGWEVDLATHPGFLGGLERSGANGTTATYYCTSTFEMLFHDVTKMPVDAQDEKQLKKKRHIGNDQVHIVWNEHHRSYRRGTIGGDFGNAQLIVTPLPDGLYSITVLRDPKVPAFGPLHGPTVVTRRILAPLLRHTALNAYRAALADPMQTKHHHHSHHHHQTPAVKHSPSSASVGVPHHAAHAFTTRREDIATIAERHRVAKWTFERFVDCVFAAHSEHAVGTASQSDHHGTASAQLEGAGGSTFSSGQSQLARIQSGITA